MMAAVVLPSLTGCSGFFPAVTATSPTSPTSPATGANSVYVANLTTTSLNGFTVGTGALTAIVGLPVALPAEPFAMAITPTNSFLYVACLGGIFQYTINTDGTITASTTSSPAVTVSSMAVSPDGGWLIGLDSTTEQLDIFKIAATTGALSSVNAPTTYTIPSGMWTPSAVRVSPNGLFIIAALGTAGDVVFPFNTGTGVAGTPVNLAPLTTTTSDNGLAIDSKSAYVYIARSGTQGGVAVYSLAANGLLTAVSASPFAAGSGTFDIILDTTGTYVYAANRADGTISGYTIVPGATTAGLTLTPLAGSPYTSGVGVRSLGVDRTGTYLLAAALGDAQNTVPPDLTVYSFSTTTPGELVSPITQATDTDPAGAFAIVLTP